MHFIIKRMEKTDITEVTAIEKECFSTPWSYESFAGELENPLAVYFVAGYQNKCVGYMGMHAVLDEGYITNIAVAAPFRRQGIAKALMEEMLAYAYRQKLKMMSLEVRQSNQAAIRFYRSYGFQIVGYRKNYYTHPTEDGHIMTRFL